MKLEKAGTSILEVAVTDISPFGIWIYYYGKEYFLDYECFPWFCKSPIQAVFEVEEESIGHLRWKNLDIDLSIDSIIDPDAYPNVYDDRIVNKSKITEVIAE